MQYFLRSRLALTHRKTTAFRIGEFCEKDIFVSAIFRVRPERPTGLGHGFASGLDVIDRKGEAGSPKFSISASVQRDHRGSAAQLAPSRRAFFKIETDHVAVHVLSGEHGLRSNEVELPF